MQTELAPLSFQHLAPELRLFCGEDSLISLRRELERQRCKRAVVVTGRSVAASSAMDALRNALAPLLAGECTTVQPNSPVPAVEETARALEQLQADAVIAVGGGSAAVTARAAGILLAEKRPVAQLCTERRANGEFQSPRLDAPKLPQFAILTTPSTAFVKAGSAVHDPGTGRRLALFDPKTRAKAIILHPEFLRSAPLPLVTTASLNSLCTAIEALESPRCDPVSEALLVQAVRLIARHLPRIAHDDVPARERLAVAAVLCGRGTEQAGGGLASVLGHAIGHRAHVDNGIVNAIVLPHTMRFNASETASGRSSIAEALRVPADRSPTDASEPTIEVVDLLLRSLDIPHRLRDIGVQRENLDDIAQAAMSDWFIGRNPRRVSDAQDISNVLEAAW